MKKNIFLFAFLFSALTTFKVQALSLPNCNFNNGGAVIGALSGAALFAYYNGKEAEGEDEKTLAQRLRSGIETAKNPREAVKLLLSVYAGHLALKNGGNFIDKKRAGSSLKNSIFNNDTLEVSIVKGVFGSIRGLCSNMFASNSTPKKAGPRSTSPSSSSQAGS